MNPTELLLTLATLGVATFILLYVFWIAFSRSEAKRYRELNSAHASHKRNLAAPRPIPPCAS